MCSQLVLISTLTLSEVRSMLPAGTHADAMGPSRQAPWRALLPRAQTAVVLRAGHCACGLLQPRFRASNTDEAHLRERYRALKVPRPEVVRALERHRRSVAVLTHAEPDALVRLVAEHARNAGVSAWLLGFSAHDDPPRLPVSVVVSRHLDDVRLDPDGWLVEDQVTLVQP
jgi:hypothetical protein